MASAGEDAVKDALNVLVSVTEKSGNLRNNLKKDILKAVSSLRKESATLRSQVEDRNKLIVKLEMKEAETNSIHKVLHFGMSGKCRGDQEATSLGLKANSKNSAWKMAPSAVSMSKHYSDVVADR
jgi:hypothetical protein